MERPDSDREKTTRLEREETRVEQGSPVKLGSSQARPGSSHHHRESGEARIERGETRILGGEARIERGVFAAREAGLGWKKWRFSSGTARLGLREKRLGGREEGPGEVVARPAQRRGTRIERGRAQIEREVRL